MPGNYTVGMTDRLAGRDEVARWLGITVLLLQKWQERYETFPPPDYVITSRKGDIPGWCYDRRDDIVAWPRPNPKNQGWRVKPHTGLPKNEPASVT